MESKYFELIVNAMEEAVVFTDQEGKIMYSNHKFSEYFNLPEKITTWRMENLIEHEQLSELLASETEVTDELFYYDDYLCNGCIFYGLMSSKHIGYNGIYRGKLFTFKKIDAIYPLLHQLENAGYTPDIAEIHTNSPELQTIKQLAKKFAATNDSILLEGESNMDKAFIARIIHAYSDRSEAQFLEIDCKTDSLSHIENLLFGQAKGNYMGKIAMGDGGTVFISNIEILPLFLQQKLIETIKMKAIRKWNTKKVQFDVRFIFGTTSELHERFDRQLFQEELYYRITNRRIMIPRLVQRPADLKAIIAHYIQKLKRAHRKVKILFEPELLAALYEWTWQGTEGEVVQVLDYLIAHASSNVIRLSDFENAKAQLKMQAEQSENIALEFLEKRQIEHALSAYTSKTKAAQSLGISRATLYRKMERYQL